LQILERNIGSDFIFSGAINQLLGNQTREQWTKQHKKMSKPISEVILILDSEDEESSLELSTLPSTSRMPLVVRDAGQFPGSTGLELSTLPSTSKMPLVVRDAGQFPGSTGLELSTLPSTSKMPLVVRDAGQFPGSTGLELSTLPSTSRMPLVVRDAGQFPGSAGTVVAPLTVINRELMKKVIKYKNAYYRSSMMLTHLKSESLIIRDKVRRVYQLCLQMVEKHRKDLKEKEERFLCAICIDRLYDCTITTCGHTLCTVCAEKCLKKYKCPFCNVRYKRKNIVKIYLP
jgi:Zinc finger, C3HC4 type (RING finger)